MMSTITRILRSSQATLYKTTRSGSVFIIVIRPDYLKFCVLCRAPDRYAIHCISSSQASRCAGVALAHKRRCAFSSSVNLFWLVSGFIIFIQQPLQVFDIL